MSATQVPSAAGESRTISQGAAEIVARLERVPISGFHTRARLILGTATFFDAFDLLIIGYVLPVLIPLWKIAPTDIGLLISVGYVGTALGGLIFGWIAERWGRMTSLLLSISLFSIATGLSALAPNFQVLFILRTLSGIGIGGEVPVAATYINEFAHAKTRGRFLLVFQLT